MPANGTVDLLVAATALVVFVAIPAALVLLIVALLRRTPTRRRAITDHAIELVRERFARGEITADDFEAALRALGPRRAAVSRPAGRSAGAGDPEPAAFRDQVRAPRSGADHAEAANSTADAPPDQPTANPPEHP